MIAPYKIDINNYKILNKIKSGGFGSVYTVQEKQTNEKYAAKIIESTDIQSRKHINREIGIMIRMKHPTIIKFYGYSLTDFSFEIQAFTTIKSDIKRICTYCASGNNFVMQKFYRCLTCNLTPMNSLGVCEACARNCHKGHDTRFSGIYTAFCDCCKKCNCKLMKDSESLQCTSIKTHGKPINQPMFYCLKCDPQSMFFICQSRAVKFHHGHKLKYLGVVESKVCNNSLIKK